MLYTLEFQYQNITLNNNSIVFHIVGKPMSLDITHNFELTEHGWKVSGIVTF